MHRLFVALRPPTAVRAALCDLMDGVPAARWQDDEQLHLTLRFIGPVERPQAEDLADALAAVRAAAPLVRLRGVGRFEERGRVNALWAGVTAGRELIALHRKVDHMLVRAGLVPDRRAYMPHVTLARIARSARTGPEVDAWLARHAGLTSEPFVPEHLILYESHLSRDGAHYAPVMRWKLQQDDAMYPRS